MNKEIPLPKSLPYEEGKKDVQLNYIVKQIATEERATSLYKNAGLKDIRVERKNHGYYLKNAEEWWNIVWYAGFRRMVSQLSPKDLEKFKKEHLLEIIELATNDGIWLNVEVLYTIGTKP